MTHSMRGWAAVTGVAERKPERWTDGETTLDMLSTIGVAAIADAGLELGDIDGLLCHPMGGVPMLVPSTIGEALGLHLTYAGTVDLGGATGAGMVWRAAAAIQAGQARAVLCLTAARRQRRSPGQPRPRGQSLGRDTSAWAEFEVPFGNVGANVGYAMIANRYLHEHDATPEQLAKIAVHQRDNACRNPDAWFYGHPITVDDVLASPMVADPLHLLEIVMPSAGAAALVVVHPDLVADAAARRLAARRRRVRHPQDDHLRPVADRDRDPPGRRPGLRPGRRRPASRSAWPRCTTATRSPCSSRWRRPASASGAPAGRSSPSTTCAGTATSR